MQTLKFQPQRLNRSAKLLLVGLYIGIITAGLNSLIIWPISYIEPSVPFVVFSPFPVAIAIAAVLAYWIEEAIRTSSYSRRNKIILASVVMVVVVAAGVALSLYVQYTVMQHLNQVLGR